MAEEFLESCCDPMAEIQRKGQIAMDAEFTIAIPGCSGGGCNAVHYLNYCPFCGTLLKPLVWRDGMPGEKWADANVPSAGGRLTLENG